MKRTVVSILVTLIVLYLGTGLVLMPNNEHAFTVTEQANSWLFTFVWSMGALGYVVMAAVLVVVYLLIRWLLGKCYHKW